MAPALPLPLSPLPEPTQALPGRHSPQRPKRLHPRPPLPLPPFLPPPLRDRHLAPRPPPRRAGRRALLGPGPLCRRALGGTSRTFVPGGPEPSLPLLPHPHPAHWEHCPRPGPAPGHGALPRGTCRGGSATASCLRFSRLLGGLSPPLPSSPPSSLPNRKLPTLPYPALGGLPLPSLHVLPPPELLAPCSSPSCPGIGRGREGGRRGYRKGEVGARGVGVAGLISCGRAGELAGGGDGGREGGREGGRGRPEGLVRVFRGNFEAAPRAPGGLLAAVRLPRLGLPV
ncbi:hypothetical protein Naga_102015g1, partial [Nannochloropsis gaditana]